MTFYKFTTIEDDVIFLNDEDLARVAITGADLYIYTIEGASLMRHCVKLDRRSPFEAAKRIFETIGIPVIDLDEKIKKEIDLDAKSILPPKKE